MKRREQRILKKLKVYPVNQKQYSQTFTAELIPCGGCKQVFDLGSEELKIHCNLCNQFFHCKIAASEKVRILAGLLDRIEPGPFHRDQQ